jgi:hypothetical protein
VTELSGDQKLITPCHPDFETVACSPEPSGALVPLDRSLHHGVEADDIAYPCKRTTPAG